VESCKLRYFNSFEFFDHTGWFAYDRPKIATNRFFNDFVKTGETVVASTNVNFYTPDLRTDRSLPAVEILGIEIKNR